MFLRGEIDFGKSFRIGPDQKSVGVVLFSRGFLARNPRFLLCPTGPFCALNAETLAEKPITQEISPAKNVNSTYTHDTKLVIWRELTESNLFSVQLFGEKEIRRLLCF
jgi:hypothetical protein